MNFYYTVDQMDAKETKVLKKLGIHPLNPIQLSYFGETESQEHLYSGSFHVKGTLLVGKPVRISEWTPLNIFSIGKIKFVISDEVNLVPDDCAFPLLQLDFEWELPWSFEGKPE
ncbi:hypothetical protein [Bacillus sp. cl95]|uniref:hypothetical protein n=1 Tax=Bacillus sp. cl95 TaxID=1761761 RepID=UPI00111391F8|nr:hypothetical protein [Bacillus sp. cl95]